MRNRRKTRIREHKDLQPGQSGVIVEEAKWNRADLVTAQIPDRKESLNEIDEKEKQEHGNTKTYNLVNLVFNSRKLSGIVLIWLLYNNLKEKRLE